MGDFMYRTTLLVNRVMSACHALITAALALEGCELRPVARPLPPHDDAG
jgi:hypothetical protein